MPVIKIHFPSSIVNGTIKLDGSKSISNRILIVRALCEGDFEINNLSTSDDTRVLDKVLSDPSIQTWDVGHAGTSFRFLTALAAIWHQPVTITGSKRMLERPIGPLGDALTLLGARIEYLGKIGYPPILVHPAKGIQKNRISIQSGVSSQFISALLLIAPYFPNGLEIELQGHIVSRPYIEMTRKVMSYFGAVTEWNGNLIRVPQGNYISRSINVESDWSAASYYYSLACIADQCELKLLGLSDLKFQGDHVIEEIMKSFGVDTTYFDGGIRIVKNRNSDLSLFQYDFTECPDLAQTVAVLCGAIGRKAIMTGLQTLAIKETNRTEALSIELEKFGIQFSAIEKDNHSAYALNGRLKEVEDVHIQTYHDHRMAMSFAPLSMHLPLIIEDHKVVTKSYPKYWEDMQSLGMKVESIDD